MYDELIKRLKNDATAFVGFVGEDLQQAADAIEELQQISAHYEEAAHDYFKDVCYYLERMPKWIPVTERLPEMSDGENISKEVYVTDGTEIAKACIMRDYEGATNWTYTGIGKITHWCEQIPLPQPPKEK